MHPDSIKPAQKPGSTQPPPPAPQPAPTDKKTEPVKNDAYAQSLLQAVNAQMEMEYKNKSTRPAISAKKLIFIAISIIALIIISVVFSSTIKNASENYDNKDSSKSLNINVR